MDILNVIQVPYFKKGNGIHIKKKNRGKFTEYCDGKVTQECIDKAKKSKNPTLRKRATFAQNSRSWSKKHQLGGIVEAGASFIPLVGTYQSYQDYKKDPTLSNLVWTIASGVGDVLQLTGVGYGLGSAIKGLKAANTTRKAVQAVNTARKATRAANQVKMLEYGQKGKNAFKGWVQSGKNVATSNKKLAEANKHFQNAAVGLGIASIDPAIDAAETVLKRQGGLISKHQKGGELVPSRNWDNTLTGKLINYSENPDSIGWDAKNRRWYAPPANKGYDTNQFGMGVDRNQTPGFKDKVKKDKKGREYLTAEDERNLRFLAIDRANKSANDRYAYAQKATGTKGSVSPKHDAITVSAIYNLGPGHVARTLFENLDAMKALFNRNSSEYQQMVHKQYKKKDRNERIDRELQFFKKRNH